MGRIFNGTALDSRDLPYVASVYGYTKTTYLFLPDEIKATVFCTGIIISPRFVLT